MKIIRVSLFMAVAYSGVAALTFSKAHCRNYELLHPLEMKMDSRKLNGANPNTLLRYRNIHQTEEDTTIALKWFEAFPKTLLQWQNESLARQNAVAGKVKVEGDKEMPGCAIKHIDNDYTSLVDGLEILPSAAPMLDIMSFKKSYNEDTVSSSNAEATKDLLKKYSHFRPKHDMPQSSNLTGEKYNARISKDLCHLSLSIAQTIETPQQWTEFVQNGGGLAPIIQCIRDAVDDIKKGQAPDVEGVELYAYDQRKENSFQAACNACKVLRDLCSRDANWAAVITDELLHFHNQGIHGSETTQGVLDDLVSLLQYTNEGGIWYTRNIWKKRRELRAKGIRIKGGYTRQRRKDARKRCRLYILQLLLGMVVASDEAVEALQLTKDLIPSVRSYSSYAIYQKLKRRWINYPKEVVKRLLNHVRKRKNDSGEHSAFLAAASMDPGIIGQTQAVSNKVLAALGHNVFIPKSPGQRGLRILCLDGGGTRGISSLEMVKSIVDAMGGEACDKFDMICGTSTGAIIAFLIGLRRESSCKASRRYDELIDKIFVKGALSTPMLLFTTASYSEVPFTRVMDEILGDTTMLDTRADPRTPLVFAIASKMSSSTSKMALFRNYNYEGGSNDNFVISAEKARKILGLPQLDKSLEDNNKKSSQRSSYFSRHEGSFRIMQKAAMRATTAAPTFFKPVMMGGDMYSDGGLIASNPTAVAIHEARQLYPEIPIEMIVSVGTGEFVNEKVSPKFGWDGVIAQIVKSATDTSRTHWIVEDILGNGNTAKGADTVSKTKYYRFDPVVGTSVDFPIDGTDKNQLEKLKRISKAYMEEPEQREKLRNIGKVLGV